MKSKEKLPKKIERVLKEKPLEEITSGDITKELYKKYPKLKKSKPLLIVEVSVSMMRFRKNKPSWLSFESTEFFRPNRKGLIIKEKGIFRYWYQPEDSILNLHRKKKEG